MDSRLVVLQVLACALLLQLATATPSMWVTNWLQKASNNLNCIDHPSVPGTTYGGHGSAPAGTNNGILFTVSNSVGAMVTSVCPGQTYALQVDLGVAVGGHMFLTTTGGSLSSPSYSVSPCGQGSRIATITQTRYWSQSLALDCPHLSGQTTITIKATYATGQGMPFSTNSITLAVDAACYNSTCANYIPPSPAPSPSPAPATNPPPTSKPVYPQCIGAALLPNPCPLGKRCFYDTECKPQSEDLVYPNCDNAAPLQNPWPAGKCCFYDSQCKPQCEDKTNSKCVALAIPTCSVTGCGWCNATDPNVCEKCWTGYLFNVNTKKCDCAPGYAGSTSCKKCAAGTVSYGGKLPTAACFTCPSGRVPNKEQSECVLPNAWDHWGYDLTNRRWGYGESTLNVSNVAQLKPKWSFTAGSDVTATPTVVDGRLYVPDWDGNVWCMDATTGFVIWSRKISDLVFAVDPSPYPLPADGNLTASFNSSLISRASPAIAGSLMVVPVMKKGGGFPYLLCLNISDGSLVWGKRVEPHPAAMLTMSPTVHAGYIYQGISSLEELWATNPKYKCCSFRGNMIKVDLSTGNIVWRTYMAPAPVGAPEEGFSGNSLWGSSPAVDVLRNQVYIATGNNYEAPEEYTKCIADLGPITPENYQQALDCEATWGKGNYHNSMLALNMDTGAVNWVRQLGGPDAWNGACGWKGSNPNCAKPGIMDLNSPDYDFAQAPMLVKACKNGFCKQLVVAGQKSGWLWALSPDTGDVHWSLPVGPGGTVGGLQWGSAADNSRIYVANNNYLSVVADLTNMKPVVNFPTTTNQLPPTSTNGGLAAAIDAYSGEILWTFANPTVHWNDIKLAPENQKHARSQAPMTVANDVVFYSSMDLDGTLFFLDARTGKLLGSFKTGMTLGCGPSVVNGKVYVGSGYANFGLGLSGNKLHMLSL